MNKPPFNVSQKQLLADAILCLHRERVAVRTECLRALKNSADAPTPQQFEIPQLMALLSKVHNMEASAVPALCPKCCGSLILAGEASPGETCEGCAAFKGLK
jgi:hypothetical protein